MKKRLHAWGHETLPDLDIEGEDIGAALQNAMRVYPCVSVARLDPISRSAIDRALKEQSE